MPRKSLNPIVISLFALVICCSFFSEAQGKLSWKAAEPNADVPEPTTQPQDAGDLAEEVTMGFDQRNTILSQYSVINSGPAFHIAQGVFVDLQRTAAFQGVPNLPYDVTVIQSNELNAFTIMGGHLFVTSALADLMGNDTGLWAAVEGHEMAHNIYRHVYNKYLREVNLQRQIEYYRYRAALGDQSANWTIIGLVTAGKLLNKKLDRNDENEADKLGLRMMVEAGYHPDFAINLFQTLKSRTGDQSKFGALFSDHPRLTSREERMRELYPEELARFRSLWPDASASPGGSPPITSSLAKVSSRQDKTTKTVSLQFQYTIHNAKGIDVAAAFLFSLKSVPVKSNDPAFQDNSGSLVAIRHFTPTTDEESSEVQVSVPSSALGISQHKLKAKACLVSDVQVLECSKEFDVSFPNK
jgi:Zn-dependent protease with chaperone function